MKHFKYILIAFLAVALATPELYSQDDGKSMIENGSFEQGQTSGMKKPQNLDDHVEGWISGTYIKADLFSETAKSDLLKIPQNAYGSQTTVEGNNYAGFRAYTKDSKKQRTYIGRNLVEQMEKDKNYCIKMQVSLADMSKYAVDNIGVYVSKNKMQKGDSKSIIKPDFQIKNRLNPVIKDREGWTTICGVYNAKGGEGAIIIGCFESDSNLDIEKLKKPSGMLGTQSLDAYYYLENVEVTEIVAASQCDCGNGGIKEEVIYSPSFVDFEELTNEEKVANSTAYFAQESAKISPVAKRDLMKFVQVLKANPSLKLKLVGHMDLSEFDESKIKARLSDIGGRRAQAILDYFIAEGLDKSRFTTQDKAASSPVSKYKTPLQLAKNRRVEFSIQ